MLVRTRTGLLPLAPSVNHHMLLMMPQSSTHPSIPEHGSQQPIRDMARDFPFWRWSHTLFSRLHSCPHSPHGGGESNKQIHHDKKPSYPTAKHTLTKLTMCFFLLLRMPLHAAQGRLINFGLTTILLTCSS